MGKRFYGVITPKGERFTFTEWPACEKFVKYKSNIIYKGFQSYEQLQEWFNNQKIIYTQGDDPVFLRVYVDGSYNHKTKRAGWAFVAVGAEGNIFQAKGEVEGPALSRQIDGELEAAIQALNWADAHGHQITIVHDYAGIAHFAVGNWAPRKEIAKMYKRRVRKYVRCGMVRFQKIYGHSGDEFNDLADKLAKEGCGIVV
jgi:ribonuclease HI